MQVFLNPETCQACAKWKHIYDSLSPNDQQQFELLGPEHFESNQVDRIPTIILPDGTKGVGKVAFDAVLQFASEDVRQQFQRAASSPPPPAANAQNPAAASVSAALENPKHPSYWVKSLFSGWNWKKALLLIAIVALGVIGIRKLLALSGGVGPTVTAVH
jgi:hypothetical protein